MRYANAWPVVWRTGATFVHDWLAYAVGAVVIGHIWFAYRDPQARKGMRTGWVPLLWAIREHKAWAQPAYDEFLPRRQQGGGGRRPARRTDRRRPHDPA